MACKGSLSGWADFSPQVPTTQTVPFSALGSYTLEGGRIAHQYISRCSHELPEVWDRRPTFTR
jgi:hypothetical protein